MQAELYSLERLHSTYRGSRRCLPQRRRNLVGKKSSLTEYGAFSSCTSSRMPIADSYIRSLSNATFAANAYFPVGTSDPQRYAYALQHPDLSRLPPCILTIAEQDILRDSGLDFANRLFRESDGGCDLHVSLFPEERMSHAKNSLGISWCLSRQ